MWTTVLILALALNFEPNRLAIIGLLLLRPHPIRQLLVFLITSFITSSSAGLIILYLVHRGSFLKSESSSALMQIGVGAVAVLAAIVLFSNIPLSRRKPEDAEPGKPSARERLLQSSSPWLAVILGVGNALPSVDYIALLLLIASSGLSPRMQAVTLFTFLIVANTVLLIPMFSYVVAKERTVNALEGLRTWVLARSRKDFAVLLGLAGSLLIAVGVHRL